MARVLLGRSDAAAAGLLLACAILLMFAGQSAANFVFPFAHYFPAYSVPPPIVRIYSGEDTTLNMAVRNGEVVLVQATPWDDGTQLWWKISPATSLVDGEGEKYWLVNVATNQAMTSPIGDAQLVKLEKFAPFTSGGTQLWVRSNVLHDDCFYQIKPFTDDNKALNGLYGGVHPGTKIAIYHTPPEYSNTIWATSGQFPFHCRR